MSSDESPYRLKVVCDERTRRIEQQINNVNINLEQKIDGLNDKLEDFKKDIIKAVKKKNNSNGGMSGKAKATVMASALMSGASIMVAIIQTL